MEDTKDILNVQVVWKMCLKNIKKCAIEEFEKRPENVKN